MLGDPGGDQNLLSAQRWGLVLPQGQDMAPILQELEPLLNLRARQQGANVRCYVVPVGLDGVQAHDWCERNYGHDGTAEYERPRYLLMLGGFEGLSLALQQALSTRAYVGRLAFEQVEDYGHYARKVCQWAQREGAAEAEVLLFSAKDGTSETRLGHLELVEPCHQHLRQAVDARRLSLAELRGPDTLGYGPEDFLDATHTTRPAVLLSMSHGLGASAGGWESAQAQQALQGAMRFSARRRICGEDVQDRSFLPGGFWLYFACFGAGMPAVSPYLSWLEQLRSMDTEKDMVDRVLRNLNGPAPRPFMAALPQKALANPKGPLGVIAHVDLAWDSSFRAASPSNAGSPSRASRFSTPLMDLARGRRVGIAARQLTSECANIEPVLVDLHEARDQGRDVDHMEMADLTLMRQDLRAFILLGDPAARLPLEPDV
ncbi:MULTISPECIES: hypothetical protein [unclassified Myxococcus]|uniref:hypothetical protein n=1 Tax=unclassified Myxococcus TaxID=2648731 RepID=UPI00157B78EC|nr:MULTISPECIES: hypothetical protein [unclassified Myxococcus]NTX39183.1 hypothetical protein [Myxococcus sp. CA033]NTX54903.1 hypothetical protein [Myxococcus sp. CA039A]